MSVLHLTLHRVDPDRVRLRYYFDNPNVFDERFAPTSELTELKRLSKTVYDGERIEKPKNSLEGDGAHSDEKPKDPLEELGRALYAWLDTPERILTGKIAASPRGTEPLVLAVAATAELKDLPWETLHDGASFLVARESLPVIAVRWRDIPAAPLPVANRPLRTLFMATSPEGVQPVLSFEEEEKAILKATKAHPLTLTVEESGDLTELRARVLGEPDAAIDVFHVTGHADHHDGVPVFLTEDDEGGLRLSTAADFAHALVRMPRLLFLSGCRTAQSPADATPSLAEAMLEKGARAVLGWARPVYDTNGIAAAAALYEGLATGLSLAKALAATYRALINAQAAHWHLLRLFITGDMPDAFVTAPGTPARAKAAVASFAPRFLDADGKMRVHRPPPVAATRREDAARKRQGGRPAARHGRLGQEQSRGAPV